MTDNRTTELLPCAHCGSNVELYEFEYPNREHAYRLMSVLGGCMVCENVESIEPTSLDAFVAAWNRRTPEQAVAATLWSGECKITGSATDCLCGDDPKVYYELSCGHRMMLYGLDVPIRCAVCGKAVKR